MATEISPELQVMADACWPLCDEQGCDGSCWRALQAYRERLCDDEGCPHHGTPHECISVADLIRENTELRGNVAALLQYIDEVDPRIDSAPDDAPGEDERIVKARAAVTR